MSRSGYSEDCDGWDLIRWRGAVAAGIRGKRGQAFLLEMWQAMHALPSQELIAGDLERDGAVCAIGSVGRSRGMDMSEINVEDHEMVAKAFDIPHAMACEIMFENHDADAWGREVSPQERFLRMKDWI